MRYLVLSDLHANWEALQAALDYAAGRWDEALCCGDLVGYGADPNAIVDWVRAQGAVTVRGNHDKACSGVESADWFNPRALLAARWTTAALSPQNLDYVARLPKGPLVCGSFELAHGSPCDEDEYVSGTRAADSAFDYLAHTLAFFGHTHLQGGFVRTLTRVEPIVPPPPGATERTFEAQPEHAYLVNPGSIGQPRDGDPRAAFALYDDAAALVTLCRVPYDIAAAQGKIRAAGLPDMLADRLSIGR